MDKEQDIFNTLVEKAKETKLTERERSKLFLFVDAYVSRNSLSSGSAKKDTVVKPLLIKSPFTFEDIRSRFTSFHAYGLRTAAAFLILAIFGTGTSFAAERALPGDILYPIKVNVNEGIKAAFLSGPERSAYEVALVKTRVDEAKVLAVQNKLSDKIQGEIAIRIDSHVSQVKKEVDTLTQNGDLKSAFEISSNLEATLGKSETTVPNQPATGTPVVNAQAVIVENIVKGPREISTQTRQETEEKIYTQNTNDDGTLAIAQAKLESVKKALQLIEIKIASDEGTSTVATTSIQVAGTTEDASTTVTTTSAMLAPGALKAKAQVQPKEAKKSETDTSLEQVRSLLEQGEEKLNNKEYNEAFRLFRNAHDITEVIQSGLDLEKDGTTTELDSIVSDLDSSIVGTDSDGDNEIDLTASVLDSVSATGTTR